MQVHAVFRRYSRGTGLRVGLAIGQTNFLDEQLALVGAAALAGQTPVENRVYLCVLFAWNAACGNLGVPGG